MNYVFTYVRFVTGTVTLLLGSDFEVLVVTAGRDGLVATDLRAVLFAVGLGAALVTSKIYNERSTYNQHSTRFIDKMDVDLITFGTFCYGKSSFATRQRFFGPYGHNRTRWFRSNRTRREVLCGCNGGPLSS